MNFIKKIVEHKIDEEVHKQFTRFGKGEFKGRFLLSLWKTKKIKVKASFEFANDLVALCSEFGSGKASGIVMSKKDISKIMKENKIEGTSETKKGGLYYQNNISEQDLTKEQLMILEEASYATLLDLQGEDFKLKIKKKLPKPGKSENKVDDKFCQLETEANHYEKIKQDFFWDMPESKKIIIKHTVKIERLIMPEGEKDYSKIREMAKRKGIIIRQSSADGKDATKEIEFTA